MARWVVLGVWLLMSPSIVQAQCTKYCTFVIGYCTSNVCYIEFTPTTVWWSNACGWLGGGWCYLVSPDGDGICNTCQASTWWQPVSNA
jgi:hypothetical protein